jgi:hypothetical protein
VIDDGQPALDLRGGCRDPINAESARRTNKSIGFDNLVVASTNRLEQSRPLLVVQLRRADEIAALLHHHLHCLSTCAAR